MNRIRGALFSMAIAAGAVLLPAEKSEAGVIDWLRCVLHPCRRPCEPDCAPPVACEPSQPCTASLVRRSYMEPRTRMTTQYALEAECRYVRRRYWDPCCVGYKTYYEPATSYVRRAYCVPVTDYVERSYYEPVTTCPTPSCPTGSCPTSPSGMPATSEGEPIGSTGFSSTKRSQPVVRTQPIPSRSSSGGLFANPFKAPPGVVPARPTSKSSSRPVPLAISEGRVAS